ncbi:MAG: adenine phosphoribosyltransferase [Vicinamibacteria bacterium]|nr:adenine phosphoribosyltransferase [Vicinamibacteria bacterium]
MESLKGKIRNVPDFPKKGVVFRDLTTLFKDAPAFRLAVDLLAEMCAKRDVDKVVAAESRGFILGSLIADRLGVGFVPVRKPGKLPARTRRIAYALEYGEDALEIHDDALDAGERALVVDDVIATGGTAHAAGALVEKIGGRIAAYAFLVELTALGGREKLAGFDVLSLIRY